MKKKNKQLLINGLIITPFGVLVIYFLKELFPLILLFTSMSSSSKDELIENYQQRETSIISLKQQFEKSIPTSFEVYIEFNDINEIDFWVYETNSSTDSMTYLFQQWNINPFDYVLETPTSYDSSIYAPKTKDLELVKSKLNWTNNTFIEIRNMLDKANCVSVKSGDPTTIGFARSGMGKYFYHLFDEPIPEDEINEWNDGCSYIYFNPKVVLGYGGGAIGGQCFPDPD